MSELEKQRNQLKELSKGLTFDEQQRRQHDQYHDKKEVDRQEVLRKLRGN